MTFPLMDPSSYGFRTGCDLVRLSEVHDSLSTFGQRYLDKIFTEAEQADASGLNRVARLAARFAAKEATVKALATPSAAFPPQEIEVAMAGPLPTLRLHGATNALAVRQGWTHVSLSLSHTDCHAMAVVFVMCADAEATAWSACRAADQGDPHSSTSPW